MNLVKKILLSSALTATLSLSSCSPYKCQAFPFGPRPQVTGVMNQIHDLYGPEITYSELNQWIESQDMSPKTKKRLTHGLKDYQKHKKAEASNLLETYELIVFCESQRALSKHYKNH